MMIDRLELALNLSKGKRVVDIGGARMNPDGRSKFDNAYRGIQAAASEYLIVDRDKSADIVCDLSDVRQVQHLHLPKCDVVLCMETLEHLRNPGIVCDRVAGLVHFGAVALVTVPRSSVACRFLETYGLGRFWGKAHHLYAFHRNHVKVFAEDNFRGLRTTIFPCLGKYHPAWPAMWLATGGRGLSWGILVTKSVMDVPERLR